MRTPPIKLTERQKAEVIAAFEQHHEYFRMFLTGNTGDSESIFDAMADMQRIRDESRDDVSAEVEISRCYDTAEIVFDDDAARLTKIIDDARKASAPVAIAAE